MLSSPSSIRILLLFHLVISSHYSVLFPLDYFIFIFLISLSSLLFSLTTSLLSFSLSFLFCFFSPSPSSLSPSPLFSLLFLYFFLFFFHVACLFYRVPRTLNTNTFRRFTLTLPCIYHIHSFTQTRSRIQVQ